jgi:hypothetical protein
MNATSIPQPPQGCRMFVRRRLAGEATDRTAERLG